MKKQHFKLSLIGGMLIAMSATVNAQWTETGSAVYLTNGTKNVGIGTTTPAFALDLIRSGSANLSLKSTTGTSNLLLDRANSAATSSVSYRTNGVGTWQTGTVGNDNFNIRNIGLGNTAFSILATNNNVGIGTAAPVQKLTVVTAGPNSAFGIYSSNSSRIGMDMGRSNTSELSMGIADGPGSFVTGSVAGDAVFRTNSGANNFLFASGGGGAQVALTITPTMVGIGTTAPFTQLSNTSTNIYGTDGYGLSTTAFGWGSTDGFGYAAGFYNAGTSVASNGVTVKIQGNAGTVLDLSASDTVSVMTVKGNGNVGIGNTAPAAKLDVAGNVKITDGTQGVNKVLTSDANGFSSWQAISFPGETDPKVGTLASNKVPKWNGTTLQDGAITDNGTNVTVDVADFDYLNVNTYAGGLKVVNKYTNNESAILRANSGGPFYQAQLELSNLVGYAHLQSPQANAGDTSMLTTSGDMWFRNGSGNVNMAIKKTGNVGIGTTTPDRPLVVRSADNTLNSQVSELANGIGDANFHLVATKGAITNNPGDIMTRLGMVYGNNGASVNGSFIRFHRGAAGNDGSTSFSSGADVERMRITSTGRVGIGTPTPGGQFELGLDQGRKPSTSTWTITSDARLKTIDGAYIKGLKEIMQLNPIAYHYKNVGDRKFDEQVLKTEAAGFTAQDVQKVFPEAVGTDADGYLNLNIHSIIIAQVNAIKELGAQNEVKDAKIDELQNENAAMRAELNDMKQCVESLCNASAAQKASSVEPQVLGNLLQNTPNPFNQTTVIRYALNSENTSGKIIIRDLSGNLVKQVNIANSGKGQVTINANELSAGTYTYTLEIAGASVDTKLMVVTK